ncbi:protein of unknown function (plasmid) [Azospirillum baldaniorum]|uniref:Uncharacterized protein n=1 Tax=Azospirillum baldaniorum TaxID=1064539 RepID=A0A9P1JTP8_9PROT|nr:protein of unknown function [Azospirillum baldaniorum]
MPIWRLDGRGPIASNTHTSLWLIL